MTKKSRRGSDDSQGKRLELQVSLEDAYRLIAERISKGEQLLESGAESSSALPAAADSWDRYNRTLISRTLFDNQDAIYEFYNSPPILAIPMNPYANELAARACVDIRRRVDQLTSLIAQLELYQPSSRQEPERVAKAPALPGPVFLIYGHDEGAKDKVARFLKEDLDLRVVVLSEMADMGTITIIEKLEREASGVGYAIAIVSPDDPTQDGQMRARQNVIFEVGYFVGLLSRKRVKVLRKGTVEWFSDLSGSLYVLFDEHGGWKEKIRSELQGAGYPI